MARQNKVIDIPKVVFYRNEYVYLNIESFYDPDVIYTHDPGKPQVNLEYVVRQEDSLPLIYKNYPSSIVNITQCSDMIHPASWIPGYRAHLRDSAKLLDKVVGMK